NTHISFYATPFARVTLASISHFFFINDTATPEIYTLSLHDALPILRSTISADGENMCIHADANFLLHIDDLSKYEESAQNTWLEDRKSTRLNSSHVKISYAVFCLKKKNKNKL